MRTKTNPAAARLLTQQMAMIKQTRKNMEKVKREALAIQTENIRTRDIKHSEISKSLEETVTLVRQRHEAVRNNIKQASVSRDVHLRVSRSLQSLEEFVRVLRETSVSSGS